MKLEGAAAERKANVNAPASDEIEDIMGELNYLRESGLLKKLADQGQTAIGVREQ